MKKFVILLLSISLILLSFSITSCGKKSAKESMNPDELVVYNALTFNIFSFKSPISVKIISVYQHSFCSVIITLSAENGYGANISEKYYAFTSDYTSPSGKFKVKKYHLEGCESLNERFAAATTEEILEGSNEALDFINSESYLKTTYRTKLLNEALEEFKAERGW